MSKNDSSKERTTIYLTGQILKALKKAAADNDRSFTRQVERILKDWLVNQGYLK